MTTIPLATVLALSIAGTLLAGGGALLLARLGRSEHLAPYMPAAFAALLVLLVSLPFGWIGLFGRW